MEKKDYFDYLNQLRDSGKINMFEAVPYLRRRFWKLNADPTLARQILREWMDSFREDKE